MPIKNALGHIIGVAQLTNKLDGMPFNKNDENLFEVSLPSSPPINPGFAREKCQNLIIFPFFCQAFAIFCGMGINNTHMYEQAVVANARQKVALEVLSYHSSVSGEELHRFKVNIMYVLFSVSTRLIHSCISLQKESWDLFLIEEMSLCGEQDGTSKSVNIPPELASC